MRTVAWRMIELGEVRTVIAAHELERTDDHAVLHVPVGAPRLGRDGEHGGPRGSFLIPRTWRGDWVHKTWLYKDLIAVHRFGDDWSCWRWLEPDGSGWQPGSYVNLEEDWRPTAVGYDSADLTLDVVVAPDGAIRFKDVDELAWAEAEGIYSAERAGWIREVGDRAAGHVTAAGWPMAVDWDRWRPPTDVGVPTIPGAALGTAPTTWRLP